MGYNEIRDVEVWDGDVRTQVLVGGEGPPLLYLHAVLGLQWDPFVESLAAHHTVYAPYLPGTVPGDPDAHKPLEDVWDLTLCYSEILDALGLGGSPVAVVGHSFGGMLGAELAALQPERVSKLVLISPTGLWTDGRPWKNPNVISMEELAAACPTAMPARNSSIPTAATVPAASHSPVRARTAPAPASCFSPSSTILK